MSRRILLPAALLLVAGCLFKGPDFFSIVGIDDGIPVPQPGDVVGRVTDGSNQGISGVGVTLTGPESRTATTDASGNFSFEGLDAGQYTVTIGTPAGFDCPTTSRTVNVPEGGEVRADFTCTLLPTTGTVTGTVTSDGSPLQGAMVTLNGSTATTDASGNFSFVDVTPGQKTLTVTVTGHDCPPTDVTVVAGQTTTTTIACTPQQSTVPTAAEIAGSWSWSRMRTSFTGSCPSPIPATGTGTISQDNPTQITAFGLHPNAAVFGPYNGATGVFDGSGTGSSGSVLVQVNVDATFLKQPSGQIEMEDLMVVQHFISGVVVCTENFDVAGQRAVASSARFKRDVIPLLPEGVSLLGLRPVSFRYRAPFGDPALPRLGLIAEEVAAVFPGAVALDAAGAPAGIHYRILTALVIGELEARAARAAAAGIARLAGAP